MSLGQNNQNIKQVGYMDSITQKQYITKNKIDSQQEFAVWLRELKRGLYNNLGGEDGEGGEREVQEGWDIGILMADSC